MIDQVHLSWGTHRPETEGADAAAGCGDIPAPTDHDRRVEAWAWTCYAARRLSRGRWPVRLTLLRPSLTGGPDGGPMLVDDHACASLAPEGAATCNDLRVVTMQRPLRVPWLVIVERAMAAGWTLRPAAIMMALGQHGRPMVAM